MMKTFLWWVFAFVCVGGGYIGIACDDGYIPPPFWEDERDLDVDGGPAERASIQDYDVPDSSSTFDSKRPDQQVMHDKNPPSPDQAIAAIQPLSSSLFVYADTSGYLNTYDVNTKKSMRLSSFKTLLLEDRALFRLSPDRKWIAFPASPDQRDIKWNQASAPGLYVMSVDGRQRRKIVDAIPAPGLIQCGAGGRCLRGVCQSASNTCSGGAGTIRPSQLQWNAQGTEVWLKLTFAGGNGGGFHAVLGINVQTGAVTELASSFPCLSFSNPAPHPSTSDIAFFFSGEKGTAGCNIDPGLYLYKRDTKQLRLLPNSAGSFAENLLTDNIQWSDDGKAISFTMLFQGQRTILAQYRLDTKQRSILANVPNVDIFHFVVSPAQEKRAILCGKNQQTGLWESVLLKIGTQGNVPLSVFPACQFDW